MVAPGIVTEYLRAASTTGAAAIFRCKSSTVLFSLAAKSSKRLTQLRNTRPRHRRNRHAHIPIELRREDVFLRVERVIPGHLLPCVRGHASHDSEHRAGSHSLSVVYGLI